MSEYRPYQHQSKPQGCEHETVFANIELWADKLPDVIVLGDYRYRLERRMGPMSRPNTSSLAITDTGSK